MFADIQLPTPTHVPPSVHTPPTVHTSPSVIYPPPLVLSFDDINMSFKSVEIISES